MSEAPLHAAAGTAPQSLDEDGLLRVDGLRVEFRTPRGPAHAVNGVSFGVERGTMVGLVGESGCGKSVTARSLLAMTPPPGRVIGGSVRFAGRDMLRLPGRELKRVRGSGMCLVPQNPWGSLNPTLTIERQFRNALRAHRRLSKAACRARAHEMLTQVGIAGPDRVLDGYAHELSGGMAQRVVIALALVLDPRLVIADEPTTGLDVTIQRQILDLIVELVARDQRAMLLVTHDLGVVAQYCHNVLVMYAGTIVESGPVAEVFARPAHPYTAALLQAVPRRGHELAWLRGTVPDLVDYPQGCPFRARCQYAFEPCATVVPQMRPHGANRAFACHLPGGVGEDAARTA